MAAQRGHLYDPSTDYVRYPTLAPLPRQLARCSGCGGSAFEFLLPQWKPVCKRCGMELELPAVVQKPLAAPTAPPLPRIQICASGNHVVLLRPDGTVRALGINNYHKFNSGQCNVQNWSEITAIACGNDHTVGLRKDGTVCAVGSHSSGIFDVLTWSGITAIAADLYQTVGIRTDGSVSVAGHLHGPDFQNWNSITAVDTSWHTVGLRKDGTVISVGENQFGQCDFDYWSGITAIATGIAHTVGLRKDGTVCAVGHNSNGRCNVDSWSNITAIAASDWHTVGLCVDGTVRAVGENKQGQCNTDSWFNVVRIWASCYFTAAQTADGTILCTSPKIQEWLRKALA